MTSATAHETWLPDMNNPSKLIKHRWDGREWRATCYARIVPYFDEQIESESIGMGRWDGTKWVDVHRHPLIDEPMIAVEGWGMFARG